MRTRKTANKQNSITNLCSRIQVAASSPGRRTNRSWDSFPRTPSYKVSVKLRVDGKCLRAKVSFGHDQNTAGWVGGAILTIKNSKILTKLQLSGCRPIFFFNLSTKILGKVENFIRRKAQEFFTINWHRTENKKHNTQWGNCYRLYTVVTYNWRHGGDRVVKAAWKLTMPHWKNRAIVHHILGYLEGMGWKVAYRGRFMGEGSFICNEIFSSYLINPSQKHWNIKSLHVWVREHQQLCTCGVLQPVTAESLAQRVRS